MKYSYFIFLFFFIVTFVLDLGLSLSRVPMFTLILCAIVILYEIVSPYVYSPR